MKKGLLFLASLMLATSIFAARSKPTVTYMSFADAVKNEAKVYLYNVEAGYFLTGGNYWGTRASGLYSTGDGGNYVSYDAFLEGKGEFKGYLWQIAESGEKSEGGATCYSFANKTTKDYLTADAWDGIWVDGGTSRPWNLWIVTTNEKNNTFEMTYEGMSGKFGFSEYAYGEQYQTCTFFVDATKTYEKDVDGEKIETKVFDGTPYTTWALVSEEEYERVLPLFTVYFKAMQLSRAIEAAKRENPSLDFSAPEAVANNESASLEEIEKAIAQVSEIKASIASYDKPFVYDIGTGGDVAPWTFDGSGTWHTNTWSTEANNGADGTDMVTPFCEYWIGSGGKLGDATIHQKIAGAAPGLYKFTADVRLYNEAGTATELTGCRMYFGDESINLDEESEMYKSGSKCVLWSKNYFSVIAIVKEGGEIDFGFEVKDAAYNWMAFKNTSLNYYGNKDVEANAAKLVKAAYSYTKADEVTSANPDLIKAYNDAVDAFNAATAIADIKAAAKAADAAKIELDANIQAYKDILLYIKGWENSILSSKGIEGEEWGLFCDFVQMGEVEGYPEISPADLKNGDFSLTTKELEEYIETMNDLFAHAVATGLTEGADCSRMLHNPDFGSSTGSTDSEGNPVLGIYNTKGWSGDAVLGGLYNYMTAERFNTTVDFYQVVKDAPAGLYKIETHAFVRPGGNGKFDGSETTNTYLYMNKFRSQVTNIVDGALPEEEALPGENCYLEKTKEEQSGQVADGTFYPSNTWVTGWDYLGTSNGYEWGYIPNCMVGSAIAFSSGRYAVTTYGLVGDGEEMKIGITSDGKKVADAADSWFLFSGFKLTYEGTNPVAVASVLEPKAEELTLYLEEHSAEMTAPSIEAAQAATTAGDGLAATEANREKLWQALQGIINALTDAQANVAAVTEFTEASTALDLALEELTTVASEAGADYTETAAYKNYKDIEEDIKGYTELNTEQITALVAKMNKVAEELIAAQAQFGSEEKPVDVTGMIVNPDFEIGNTNGWTLEYEEGGYRNLQYESASYTNEEVTISKFVNAWKSGAALGNGKIYQVLADLPAGTYRLEADMIATKQYAEKVVDEETGEEDAEATAAAKKDVKGAYLFIQEKGEVLIGTDVATGDGQPEHFTVTFVKQADDTDLTIGVMTFETDVNWLAADNFKLFALGKDIPVAINNIDAKAAANKAIYNLAGQRVNSSYKGIVIKNGKKVLVK